MDMLKPKVPWRVTLADVKKSPKVSEAFFNLLVNPTKFMTFEQRGFGFNNLALQDYTNWAKFAEIEYRRMAAEEEEDEFLNADASALNPEHFGDC